MKFKARYFSGTDTQTQEIYLSLEKQSLEGRLQESDELIVQWPIDKIFFDSSSPHVPLLANTDVQDARIEWRDSLSIQEAFPQLKKSRSYLLEVGGRRWIPIGLGILSLVLLIYFSVGPISHALSKKIPFEWEKKHLSEKALFSLWKPCSLSPKAKQSFDEILKNIYPLFPTDNNFTIQLDLIKNEDANAFTLPGGKILVTSGLLQKSKTPSWLQGILAHEIAHVELRHVTASLLRVTLLESLFSLFVASNSKGLSPQTLLSLVERSYDRNSEREADARGIERLVKAGISPTGLENFFKDDKDLPAAFSLLSTHPTNKERIENFKNLIQKNKDAKLKEAPYNSQNWNELRTSCASSK